MGVIARSLVLVMVACGSADGELSVRVVTDYAAGVDFVRIDTFVQGPGEDLSDTRVAEAGTLFESASGVQVAEFLEVPDGEVLVEVRLRRADTSILAARRVSARVDGYTSVTVTISRDCEECATPDGGLDGGGAADAGQEDSGSEDASPLDAAADAGLADGSTDSGSWDASPADSGTADSGTADTGAVDTGREDAGPTCLDPAELQGDYHIQLEGDCPTWSTFAEQDIDPTVGGGACDITFTSIAVKGWLGLNGTVAIDESGSFTNGALQLNTSATMCDGIWDSEASSMTVRCGTCTITLELDG